MTPTRSRTRGLLLCGLLAATFVAPRAAEAQLDTAAAREARAALRDVRNRYSSSAQWEALAQQMDWPDVQFEVLAGERGNHAVLETATRVLLSGKSPQFGDEPFARLARALDLRAQELVPLPPAQWPAACRTQAAAYVELTPQDVDRARQELARRLEQFAGWLPSVRTAGNPWHAFLFWDETERLAAVQPGPAPDAATLDRLETRWASAPTVWDDNLLLEASLAARAYIRTLRCYLKGETSEQHAAAWNALAEQLETASSAAGDVSKIAAAVSERESLGQSSRLTASIRRALSQPNLVVQIPTQWLEEQVAQNIDEPYDVDGVFAGTYSRGQGRLVGTMRGQMLPSEAVGQWVLRFNGTSSAHASGSQDRVYVVSRASTQVAATKPFLLDVRGLTPQRALAGADTSIVYEQIDAPGFARRRNAAVSETYARRPQAEAESAAYARRSILERINSEAAKLSGDFNKSYHEQLRDRRIGAHRPAPEVRVRTADGLMSWECLLEGPRDFAASSRPPDYEAGTEIVMSLASSAMEEQAAVALAGREMTSEELVKAMGSTLGAQEPQDADAFNVAFESDPCDVRIDEEGIHARLYITKFDAADVKYPAMTVDAVYKPEQREKGVVFVRQGRLRVAPLVRSEGEAPVISGRQQTLRLAVQRKLEKVLTDELTWSGSSLPLPGNEEALLELKRARLAGPWLQLGLSTTTPPKTQRTSLRRSG